MEKIITKADSEINQVILNNEKLIANILHDIKSPLYSIKIGLENKLENELNRDIYETVIDLVDYIDNFLVNYSFKLGKFNIKNSPCNIKELVNKKIENYKYIFINKNIHVDIYCPDDNCTVNTIPIFLSSVFGNIISNMALHASENKDAEIDIVKSNSSWIVEFRNYYSKNTSDFSLGLDFSKNLTQKMKIDFKISKTKDRVEVSLKIPML